MSRATRTNQSGVYQRPSAWARRAARSNATATLALWGAACLTLAVLAFVVVHVLSKGMPHVTLAFLRESPRDLGRAGGVLPAIIGTAAVTALAIAIATPLGVGTAVYLTEYSRATRFAAAVRFGAESLAGIPSIIFGLFGFILFVIYLGLGWSILSGALTLATMVLPTIVRTSEEAIRSVPDSYREVSYALGATRWQTVYGVVLPNALPGIATGVVLALGRSVGETAAVIFTAGTSLRLPTSILDPVRTLPVHFYILAREGISMQNAYATAAVLLVAVIAIDAAAYLAVARAAARRAGGRMRPAKAVRSGARGEGGRPTR